MDPFCSVTYKGDTSKSFTQAGANLYPTWNHVFEVVIMESDKELMLSVYDQDAKNGDNLIGEASLNAEDLMQV